MRAGAGELDARVHAHDAAAEADDDVPQGRVAIDARLMGCRMHGVVVPLLHGDDGRGARRRGRGSRRSARAAPSPCGAARRSPCELRHRLEHEVRVRQSAVTRARRRTTGSSSSAPAGMRRRWAAGSRRPGDRGGKVLRGGRPRRGARSPTGREAVWTASGADTATRHDIRAALRRRRTAARAGRPACASS